MLGRSQGRGCIMGVFSNQSLLNVLHTNSSRGTQTCQNAQILLLNFVDSLLGCVILYTLNGKLGEMSDCNGHSPTFSRIG